MSAANFYSNYPGSDLAALAARFIVEKIGHEKLAEAVVLLPTRRASLALRDAFRQLAGGTTMLLPRMVSLADVGDELLTLLGHEALPILASIPPAMHPAQRRYLLARQVMIYERARFERDRAIGRDVSESSLQIAHALKLAEYLEDLQDRCVRSHIDLSYGKLKELVLGDYAEHWKESVQFLDIVGDIWPSIEAAEESIIAASHEVQLLTALRNHWTSAPPNYPVFAVGSTASQPTTAALLSTIAQMAQGYVILPGLDPRISPQAWGAVHESHPYFHLKNLLDANGLNASDVQALGEAPPHCSIWLEALCRVEAMEQWRRENMPRERFAHLRLVTCQHAEEEARVITLLMREGLENPTARVALITPDESLMARVAAHLAHYGLVANRLSQGSLADTQAGSLMVALLEAIAAPESTRTLVQLLRHPLVQLGDASSWAAWLDMFEQEARGINRHRIGQLPAVKTMLRETKAYAQLKPLVRELADLSRVKLVASEWVRRFSALLESLAPLPGQGQEKASEALEQCAGADLLGKLDGHGFAELLKQALKPSWRGPQLNAHPQLTMLTPVEARLQRFDRVILGNMIERLWPGIHGQSPWLNLAQQQELGLPGVAQHSTLIAHDVLMHGSAGEVFLTYPARDAGSPAARSRYLERLLALAQTQGIDLDSLQAADYPGFALERFTAPYAPESAPRPMLAARPEKLRVSALDRLISDPFSVYAQTILGLWPLDELDAEPEQRELGNIVHAALETLANYWTQHGQGPDAAMLRTITDEALRDYADRPAVQLFWSRRLIQALSYTNHQEEHRRGAVVAELPIQQPIATPHGAVLLSGKIDRLEGAVVVDHKTGKAPIANHILEGKALQLLAYALMLSAQEKPVEAVEYWELPAGKRAGKPIVLEWTPERAAELGAKFHALLAEFMDPSTEFLARPESGTERFDNDYDGISRYDEWAE